MEFGTEKDSRMVCCRRLDLGDGLDSSREPGGGRVRRRDRAVFPRIGVLDGKAVKQTNFLTVAFSAGAISMGNVLMDSHTLALVSGWLVDRMSPLFTNSLSFTMSLYLGGFLYHFMFANRQSMLITSLPLLLTIGAQGGLNLLTIALIWTFGGGGGLFIYQSGVYVMGYSFGHFNAKDFFKVALILTIFEGAMLLLLVHFYWPFIGLSWRN